MSEQPTELTFFENLRLYVCTDGSLAYSFRNIIIGWFIIMIFSYIIISRLFNEETTELIQTTVTGINTSFWTIIWLWHLIEHWILKGNGCNNLQKKQNDLNKV